MIQTPPPTPRNVSYSRYFLQTVGGCLYGQALPFSSPSLPPPELRVILGSWVDDGPFTRSQLLLRFAPEDETFHISSRPDVRLRHYHVSSVSVLTHSSAICHEF
jgi:hypothetical protein